VDRVLEIHPAALAEAEEAARYYAERSLGAAVAFAAELDAAIAEIERAPHALLRHVHDTHRILLRRYPFAIIFRLEEQRILIVAIAHGNRRPGYWARRLQTVSGPG
jgi:plasmid stabilization system protein ParE